MNPEPAREFTVRECAKILGSVIGGLLGMAPPEVVRGALLWWVENWDKATALMRRKPQ